VKLTHVRLLVDDVSACFRFYRDVMGFEPTWGAEGDGYADFDTGGGSTLALMDREGQANVVQLEESGDGAMLIVGVDDLDSALAELTERGADPGPVTERPDWGIRFAHLRDPAGNLIEVNEAIPMVDE
jgi:lactoylglutathione lyase